MCCASINNIWWTLTIRDAFCNTHKPLCRSVRQSSVYRSLVSLVSLTDLKGSVLLINLCMWGRSLMLNLCTACGAGLTNWLMWPRGHSSNLRVNSWVDQGRGHTGSTCTHKCTQAHRHAQTQAHSLLEITLSISRHTKDIWCVLSSPIPVWDCR